VDAEIHAESLPDDVSGNLAPQFRNYADDDLQTLRSILVAAKTPDAS